MSTGRVDDAAVIAGLPMYDLPHLRSATDALWAAIAGSLSAQGLVDVPPALTRDLEPEALWTAPDLIFAQACGLPLVTLLEGRVRFVATPIYAVAGCAGGDYRSWLVVREGEPATGLADLEGGIAAINAPHSQSGANALLALTAEVAGGRAFFADIVVTGGHAGSVEAVRGVRADCAAIDCVTWHHLDPQARMGLRILSGTPTAPALPFVTAGGTDDATLDQLRRALRAALADAPEVCRTLALAGLMTNAAAYGRIRAMLEHGLRHGCARLATVMRDLP